MKTRVAVVFGGRSSEHAISCVTAGGVLASIDRSVYDVVAIGITQSGTWVRMPDDPERLAIVDGVTPQVEADAPRVIFVPDPSRDPFWELTDDGMVSLGPVDVVLPLLHGPFGEDGTIQGAFELADIRYVGPGVFASAAGMDKHFMKVVLAAAGLPVSAGYTVDDLRWRTDAEGALDQGEAMGFPLFVKPARAGSSMGVGKAKNREELRAAIEAAREHDPKVLVEEMIVGREIECAVLQGVGDAAPDASVVGEIAVDPRYEFYDYQAKYFDPEAVALTIPAAVDADVVARLQDLAAKAFLAFGAEGLSRVDFFVREDGSAVINEINTMPGFTPFSMFPQLWAASGITYPQLIDRLIQSALARPVGLR